MKNLKSIGAFDVDVPTTVREVDGTRRVIKRHRIMVTVDAAYLARELGGKAAGNKSRKARVAYGAVEVVDLGGVVQS